MTRATPTYGSGRVLGGALLLALALTACEGTSAGAAGDATTVDASPGGAPMHAVEVRAMVRIAPGITGATLGQMLGPPTARRPLKNDQPWVMGVAVIDYAFTEPVVRFLDQDGREVARGRALQIVIDPDDRVLRLVPDPNIRVNTTVGPAQGQTLRGSAVLPHAAEIPEGARVRGF